MEIIAVCTALRVIIIFAAADVVMIIVPLLPFVCAILVMDDILVFWF